MATDVSADAPPATADDDREAVMNAILAGRIATIICLVLVSALACFDVAALCEQRVRRSLLRYAKHRATLWLTIISLLGMWTLIITTLMWWVNWIGNDNGCAVLVAPMLPLVYIVLKQCLYLFLFDRAKVVHTALRIENTLIALLRWVIVFFASVGIPLGVWWIFIVYWGGRVVVPEGVCVEYPQSVAGVVVVASIDLVLSLAMLILFIVPLMRHARKVRDDEITPLFRKLIRKNLLVSGAMMCSTCASLTIMTVAFSLANASSSTSQLDTLQIWATFFPMTDTMLTVVLPHFLTNAWMHTKVQTCCSQRSTSMKSPRHVRRAPFATRANGFRIG
jgi:hypothetical protein